MIDPVSPIVKRLARKGTMNLSNKEFSKTELIAIIEAQKLEAARQKSLINISTVRQSITTGEGDELDLMSPTKYAENEI